MGLLKTIYQRIGGVRSCVTGSTNARSGDAAEAAAIVFLQRQGLQLVERNYKTPGRGGGEIDAIMRAADGTLVFVEVRQRSNANQGGAAASVNATKQRRLLFAARCYLQQLADHPPCRFDVMACDGGDIEQDWQWLQGAFEASE